MVPMLTCGLVRSNFAFATWVLLWTVRASYVVDWVVLRARGGSGQRAYWPVAFAMISLATFAGTSA